MRNSLHNSSFQEKVLFGEQIMSVLTEEEKCIQGEIHSLFSTIRSHHLDRLWYD